MMCARHGRVATTVIVTASVIVTVSAMTVTGVGAATAHAIPLTFQQRPTSSAADDERISMHITTPTAETMAIGDYPCSSTHPYLVMEPTRNNSSRLFRKVSYRTGDARPLDALEYVIPTTRNFNPTGDFTSAYIFVQLDDSFAGIRGHKNLTYFCATTPKAANQE